MSSSVKTTTTTSPTSPTSPSPTSPAPTSTDSFLQTTAKVGSYIGYYHIIILIIVAICLLAFGIYELVHKNKLADYTQITALIQSSTCNASYRKNTTNYLCSMVVSYTVNNVSYQTPLTINSTTLYNKNSSIQIYYDNTNPNNIVQKPAMSNKTVGYICIGISIILVIAAYILYRLNKNKTFQQLEVVSAVLY